MIDFMKQCVEAAGLRFYYESENDEKVGSSIRISLSFPPPMVFVNTGAIYFSDACGNKLMLSGELTSERIRTHYFSLHKEDREKDWKPFNSMLYLLLQNLGLR